MAEKEYIGKADLLYIFQLMATEYAKYVKKVEGKDLSTNDFTNELKAKLEGIDLTKYSTTEEMNTAIATEIGKITGIKFVKLASKSELPEVGEVGTIYLVPKTTVGTDNIYSEYFWNDLDKKYELMGDTTVDLTNYLQKTDVVELSTAEVKATWDSVFTS